MSESQQDDEQVVRHIDVDGADVVWCGPGEPTEQDRLGLADIVAAVKQAYADLPPETRARYDERAAQGRERLMNIRRLLMEEESHD